MGKKGRRRAGGNVVSTGKVTTDAVLTGLALVLFAGAFLEFFIFGEWNQAILFTIFCSYGILFVVLLWREGVLNRSAPRRIFRFLADRKRELMVCCVLSVAAFIIGYFLLTPHGAGLSGDSLNYIVTGENLNTLDQFKQGFIVPVLYTMWPPLYPAMIAALMKLGFAAEEAARLIPVLSFSILVFPLFFLGAKTANRAAGLLACGITLVLYPFWYVTSWAWSEMPFILFSVTSLLFITWYLADTGNERIWLFLSAFFASLACLTRYIGLALLVAVICVIICRQKNSIRRIIVHSLEFLVLSGLPVALWFYRNITRSGYWIGMNKGVSQDQPFTVLSDFAATVFHDVFGVFSTIPVEDGIVVVTCGAVLFLIFLVFVVRKDVPLPGPGAVSLRGCIPLTAFIAIYTGAVLASKMMWRLIDPISTRFVSPLYPALILVALVVAAYGISKSPSPGQRKALVAAAGAGILFFVLLQASASVVYSQGLKDGQGYGSSRLGTDVPVIRWIDSNVTVSEDVYINTQLFWYLDYKYQIPAAQINLHTILRRPDLESIIKNVLETDSKINFIIDRKLENESDLASLNTTLYAIARKNEFSFEYLEIPGSGNEFEAIRIGNRTPHAPMTVTKEYLFFALGP